MKKILSLLIISFLLFNSTLVKGQCGSNRAYRCTSKAGNAIYLRDFNTKLRTNTEISSATKWTVVLNKGTHYRFTLCTPDDIDGQAEMRLYDSKSHIFSSPLGYTDSNNTNFDYICDRSGMYYVSIGYKPYRGKKRACAVGILSFVGKQTKLGRIKKKPTITDSLQKISGIKEYRALDEISEYDKTKILLAEGKSFKKFPKRILKLTNLKELRIGANNFKKIPKNISNLQSLTAIDLSFNENLNFEDAFLNLSQLPNLEYLGISNNSLRSIPENITLLKNLTKIHIPCNAGFNIKHANSLLRKLPNLKSLKLINTDAVLLNTYLQYFHFIENIDFSSSFLSTVPGKLLKRENLKSLNLSDNNFERFKVDLRNMTNLEELNLSFNLIDYLPTGNSALKRVNIEANYIGYNEMARFIGECKNLEEINIADNYLSENDKHKLINDFDIIKDNLKLYDTELSKDLKNIEQTRMYIHYDLAVRDSNIVYRLDLSNQFLDETPKEISKFKNLIFLNLKNIHCDSIYNFVSDLKHLKTLNIKKNNISEYQKREIINTLQNTQVLAELHEIYPNAHTLTDKELSMARTYYSVPKAKQDSDIVYKFHYTHRSYFKSNPPKFEELIQFSNIQDIKFISCKIKKIPAEIQNLTKLQRLYLSNNDIEKIPYEISNLKWLSEINLSENKLNKFPEIIFDCKNIEIINLSDNNIHEIPTNIDKLKNVKSLNLSKTKIKKLPQNFFKLKNLSELNLSNCELTEIPFEIEELKKLKILDLENNKIKILPTNIVKLKNLQIVNLRDNRFTENEIQSIKREFKKKLPNCKLII